MRHDVSESFITFVYICTHVFLTVAGVICPQFGNKDSAKNRFSEEKENKLSFLSVRFLFKSKTKQNKSPKTFRLFILIYQKLQFYVELALYPISPQVVTPWACHFLLIISLLTFLSPQSKDLPCFSDTTPLPTADVP